MFAGCFEKMFCWMLQKKGCENIMGNTFIKSLKLICGEHIFLAVSISCIFNVFFHVFHALFGLQIYNCFINNTFAYNQGHFAKT